MFEKVVKIKCGLHGYVSEQSVKSAAGLDVKLLLSKKTATHSI